MIIIILSYVRMCLHPVQIPNPNFGRKPKPGSPLSLHDCTSQYLNVPCGYCPQCIALKQMYWVQRVQMESLENHLFFATLTYNEPSLPRLSLSTGYDIPYADVRDLQCCFKRLQKSNAFIRPFRWFAVSERGSLYGRPHFHVLFSIPKEKNDTYFDCLNLEQHLFSALLHEWRRNYGSTRSPDYRPLCTYFRKFFRGKLSTNFDLHYADPYGSDAGLASVAFYCLKYMLKPSTKETRLRQALHLNLSQDEYDDVWPIVRSGRYVSHNYGDNPSALEHIRKGVADGLAHGDFHYPIYINPDSGQTFPLAPYYRRKGQYYSFEDGLALKRKFPSESVDTIHDFDKKSLDQFYNSIKKYEKVLSKTRVDYLDVLADVE